MTFLFNGGREEPYVHEERILVQSPKRLTSATLEIGPGHRAHVQLVRELSEDVVRGPSAGHARGRIAPRFGGDDGVGRVVARRVVELLPGGDDREGVAGNPRVRH